VKRWRITIEAGSETAMLRQFAKDSSFVNWAGQWRTFTDAVLFTAIFAGITSWWRKWQEDGDSIFSIMNGRVSRGVKRDRIGIWCKSPRWSYPASRSPIGCGFSALIGQSVRNWRPTGRKPQEAFTPPPCVAFGKRGWFHEEKERYREVTPVRVLVKTARGVASLSGEEWLRRIRHAAASPSARILKDYTPTASTLTYCVDVAGLGFCWLKQYRISPIRKLLSPLRQSRARHVWEMSERLLQAGAHIPKPYLIAERYRVAFLVESYVVTEWLGGRIPLSEWYRQRQKEGKHTGDAAKRMIVQAVRMVARFHQLGALHGDLKWSNFLLHDCVDSPIIMVDLDATRFDVRPNQRGKDLARFTINALACGMEQQVLDEVFEVYQRALGPLEPDRIRKAYERYVRRKLPGVL
jgi:tRNA A-37 threonylcarbamoyl transferase component Bud32